MKMPAKIALVNRFTVDGLSNDVLFEISMFTFQEYEDQGNKQIAMNTILSLMIIVLCHLTG